MLSFLAKIRFLPVTIFVMTLMLTVKVGEVWEEVGQVLNGAISVTSAQAQNQAGGPPKPPAPPAAPAAPTAPANADATPAPEGEDGDGEAKQVATRPEFGEDPTLLTQTEIDLLQQLATRRDTLDKREKEIEIQGGLLRAAESRINKKVDELRRLQETIDKLIKTYDDQQDQKVQSLVKIYENMKPKDAARIFEELDMDTLLLVAERMKERKLAGVMAKMAPRKAKEMTVELTRLRELPKNDGS